MNTVGYSILIVAIGNGGINKTAVCCRCCLMNAFVDAPR